MTIGNYLTGVVVLAAMVAPIIFGAYRLRARMVPDWTGVLARLAESVLGLALLLAVAEVLGALGQFRRGPMIAGCVAISLVAAFFGRSPTRAQPEDPPRVSRAAKVLALACVAVVLAEWSTHVLRSLDVGMLAIDDLRYHMPLAARFAKTGWLTRLHFTELDLLPTFQPANAEVVHGIGILSFGRDILSPLLNMAWLALALLAAWCIGRPRGLGPVTLAAAVLVLVVPVVAITQPGTAGNDVVALALLLAAIALFVNGNDRMPAALLAALAAGLAIGTKPYMLVPVAALWAGATVLAPRGSRRGIAITWGIGLAASGGFWYLRNLVRVGNPIPLVDAFGLPSPHDPVFETTGFSVFHYISDGRFWRTIVPRGLNQAIGPLWPVIVLLVPIGLIAAAVSRSGRDRVISLVGITAAVAYGLTPYSAGGPDGDPWLFPVDTRFVLPAVAIGLIGLVLAVAQRVRRGAAIAGAAVLAAILAMQFAGNGLWAAWQVDHRWTGLALGVLVLAVGVLVLSMRMAPDKRMKALGALALLIVSAALGWVIQRPYVRDRYVQTGDQGFQVWALAQRIQDTRIAIVGFPFNYPLYGPDSSNTIDYIGRRGPHGNFSPVATCPEWRRAVASGGYRYVVVGSGKVAPKGTPEAEWTRSDPSASEIVRDRDVYVFALSGPLDPAGCP